MTDTAHERLLAKLLRDLLRGEQFESLADVREALKCRCARYHPPIRYDGDLVERTLTLVGSNTPLVTTTRPVSPPRLGPTTSAIGRAEAQRIYQTVRHRWQQESNGSRTSA